MRGNLKQSLQGIKNKLANTGSTHPQNVLTHHVWCSNVLSISLSIVKNIPGHTKPVLCKGKPKPFVSHHLSPPKWKVLYPSHHQYWLAGRQDGRRCTQSSCPGLIPIYPGRWVAEGSHLQRAATCTKTTNWETSLNRNACFFSKHTQGVPNSDLLFSNVHHFHFAAQPFDVLSCQMHHLLDLVALLRPRRHTLDVHPVCKALYIGKRITMIMTISR